MPITILIAVLLASPGLRGVASAAEPAIQKRAFLVGVAKYKKDGLANLNYSEDDMRELGVELSKHGFQVTTVLGQEATHEKLTAALDTFLESLGELEKTDVALIAFSGHGVQKQTARDGRNDEDAFFCPVDAMKDNPDTLISIGLLMDQLQIKSGSSQNLVLVDACRNNPAKGAKGIDGSTARNLGNKISVLFSSTNGQQSFESSKAKHGVFTHFLLEGLRGGATNRRGEVTWLNLASYVMDEVPLRASELLDDPNAEQRPNLIGNLVRQPVLARLELPNLAPKRIEDANAVPTKEAAPVAGSLQALLEKADASYTKKNYNEAIEILTEAIAIELKDESAAELRSSAFGMRAQNLVMLEKNDEALADMDSALEISPDWTPGLKYRAAILFNQKQPEKAIVDLNRVLKVDPKDVHAHVMLATSLNSTKQYEAAIARLKKALAIDPKFAPALSLRGDILLDRGKQKEAIADYEAVLKIEPGNTSVQNNLAWVLATANRAELRNGKRAIKLAKEACEKTEYKQAHILSTLAAAYAETGDFKTAQKWCDTALGIATDELKPAIQEEFERYEQGKRWREEKGKVHRHNEKN